MIVNPDHMSQAGVDDTLTLLETRELLGRHLSARLDGPGQLAAAVEARRHGVPRPLARRPTTSKEWQRYRPRSTPFAFGWGYGADLGGLSHQPVPTGAGASPTRSGATTAR